MESNAADNDRGGDTPRRNVESSVSPEAAPQDTNDVSTASTVQPTVADTAARLPTPPQQAYFRPARHISRAVPINRVLSETSASSGPRSQIESGLSFYQPPPRQGPRRPLNDVPYISLDPNTEAVSNPRPAVTPGFELPRELFTELYRPRTGIIPRFNPPPASRFAGTDADLSFTSGTENHSFALVQKAQYITRIIYIDLDVKILGNPDALGETARIPHPVNAILSNIGNYFGFGRQARSDTTVSATPSTRLALEDYTDSSYPAFTNPVATQRALPPRAIEPSPPAGPSPNAPQVPAHLRGNTHSRPRPNYRSGNALANGPRLNQPGQALPAPAQRNFDRTKGNNNNNKDLSPVKEEDSRLSKAQEGEEKDKKGNDDEDDEEEELQAPPKSRHDDKDENGPSDQPPTGRAAGGNVSSSGTVSPDLDRSGQGDSSGSKSSASSYGGPSKQGPTDSPSTASLIHFEVAITIDVKRQTFHLIVNGTCADMASTIPRPGPAKLTANAGLDEWLEEAKQCHYLPERAMKELCEMVKEVLMEESNIQPVCTPVTVCGDIHGQFYDLLELFRVAGGMPGETNVQAPKTATSIITSEDIEPPTEITDPKLKKRLRNRGSQEATTDDADDEDADTEASPARPDSAVEVSTSSQSAETRFIFLGDFVDRGYFSLETFTLLMCLKAKRVNPIPPSYAVQLLTSGRYPDRIVLVRGNHESRQITQVYGFYEECQQKYGNASVWKACCHVFDFLVLAAIVDGELLCVHGGLSPEIRTIDQIRVVARAQEIPHEGAFCDLVWSDPEDVETWAISPRGAGWLFGDKVATEFNHVNGLKLIARAHQLVNEGYKYHFPQNSVVTVWSAPNYCYRCGNVASIMTVDKEMTPKFSIFSAVPDDQRHVPANRRGPGDYFL